MYSYEGRNGQDKKAQVQASFADLIDTKNERTYDPQKKQKKRLETEEDSLWENYFESNEPRWKEAKLFKDHAFKLSFICRKFT